MREIGRRTGSRCRITPRVARRLLDCGIIERGVARVVCPSCKVRGLCPSCDGQGMCTAESTETCDSCPGLYSNLDACALGIQHATDDVVLANEQFYIQPPFEAVAEAFAPAIVQRVAQPSGPDLLVFIVRNLTIRSTAGLSVIARPVVFLVNGRAEIDGNIDAVGVAACALESECGAAATCVDGRCSPSACLVEATAGGRGMGGGAGGGGGGGGGFGTDGAEGGVGGTVDLSGIAGRPGRLAPGTEALIPLRVGCPGGAGGPHEGGPGSPGGGAGGAIQISARGDLVARG